LSNIIDLSFFKPGVRPQVIHGMTLGNLLRVLARNDFRVDKICTERLFYLLIIGVLNSIYGACDTIFNARQIRAVEIDPPPLFIIGHWRSGTTHLHNLLSQDENFTSPRAFQSLFPHHFLFTEVAATFFNWVAPDKRPMDNMPFSAHTPHEDEFGIAAHSTVSPYMKFLFPVTGDDGYSELDPKRLRNKDFERWKDSLVLFMKKVTLSNPGRIVLKSPPHLGRVSTLLEIFPKAQFVHIVRNPYQVYLSTHKLWSDGLGPAHLQIPQPESVDEIILSWYIELFSLFERDRGLIPAGSLYEMKYEDLEAEPIETLRGMYKGLGLAGFEPFEERLKVYLKSIADYEKNTFYMSEADREKVRRVWGPNFERYDYPI
jgi:omega-hydroxy-beta-dihydromenaquinone-9 sulfotransferase